MLNIKIILINIIFTTYLIQSADVVKDIFLHEQTELMLECTSKAILKKDGTELFTWNTGVMKSKKLSTGFILHVTGTLFFKNVTELKGKYTCETGSDDTNKKIFNVYKTVLNVVPSLNIFFSISYFGTTTDFYLNNIKCKFDENTDDNNCQRLIRKDNQKFQVIDEYDNSHDDIYTVADSTALTATTYKLIQTQDLVVEVEENDDLSLKCVIDEEFTLYGLNKQICTKTDNTNCGVIGITVAANKFTIQNGNTVWLVCKNSKHSYTKQIIAKPTLSTSTTGRRFNLYTVGPIRLEVTCTAENQFFVNNIQINQNQQQQQLENNRIAVTKAENKFIVITNNKFIESKCGTANSLIYNVFSYSYLITKETYVCPSKSTKTSTDTKITCTDAAAFYSLEVTIPAPRETTNYFIENTGQFEITCQTFRIGSLSKCATSNKVVPCLTMDEPNNSKYNLDYENVLFSNVVCADKIINFHLAYRLFVHRFVEADYVKSYVPLGAIAEIKYTEDNNCKSTSKASCNREFIYDKSSSFILTETKIYNSKIKIDEHNNIDYKWISIGYDTRVRDDVFEDFSNTGCAKTSPLCRLVVPVGNKFNVKCPSNNNLKLLYELPENSIEFKSLSDSRILNLPQNFQFDDNRKSYIFPITARNAQRNKRSLYPVAVADANNALAAAGGQLPVVGVAGIVPGAGGVGILPGAGAAVANEISPENAAHIQNRIFMCYDGEIAVKTEFITVCPATLFKCSDNICIANDSKCNGVKDCENDEMDCQNKYLIVPKDNVYKLKCPADATKKILRINDIGETSEESSLSASNNKVTSEQFEYSLKNNEVELKILQESTTKFRVHHICSGATDKFINIIEPNTNLFSNGYDDVTLKCDGFGDVKLRIDNKDYTNNDLPSYVTRDGANYKIKNNYKERVYFTCIGTDTKTFIINYVQHKELTDNSISLAAFCPKDYTSIEIRKLGSDEKICELATVNTCTAKNIHLRDGLLVFPDNEKYNLNCITNDYISTTTVNQDMTSQSVNSTSIIIIIVIVVVVVLGVGLMIFMKSNK